MTVEEIIDQALAQGDNVNPASADYLQRRRLALTFLREVVDEVWWVRDWPWRRRDGVEVVIPATQGYASLPLDFNSLGVFGGVYLATGGDKLDEVPESVIEDFNRAPGYSAANIEYFSIHGQDETTFLAQIRIPRNASEVTLALFYLASPPFLLDAGDTDGYGSVSPAISRSDTTATAVAADHGFESGQDVLVAGADQAEYNGSYAVTVIDADTFSYEVSGSPVTPATGPITATLDVARANRAVLRVPPKYHQSILTWGVRAKMRESKGDARWQYAQGEFVKGLKGAMLEEAKAQTRRGGQQQLPSFFGYKRSPY